MRSKNYISPIICVLESVEEYVICSSATPNKTMKVEDEVVIDVHSKERGGFYGDDKSFYEGY